MPHAARLACAPWTSGDFSHRHRRARPASARRPPACSTERGAHVVVLDMNDAAGEALAKELGGIFAHADVTDTDEVIAAVEAAKELGPLRVAGQLRRHRLGQPHHRQGRQLRVGAQPGVISSGCISINLIGTFNCIRLAATAMSQTEPLADGERGAIVNTASLAAFDGQIGQAAYSASKGGVVGMTLPIARDLAVVGIRVNTIAPGLIDTPIYGSGEGSEAFKAQAQARRGVSRPARAYADEFASLAVELITNSYMNGETIRIDGAARLQPK